MYGAPGGPMGGYGAPPMGMGGYGARPPQASPPNNNFNPFS
jgi:hypothetical protein